MEEKRSIFGVKKKLCATPTFKNGGDFNARRYL